jgi:hypothetical protein
VDPPSTHAEHLSTAPRLRPLSTDHVGLVAPDTLTQPLFTWRRQGNKPPLLQFPLPAPPPSSAQPPSLPSPPRFFARAFHSPTKRVCSPTVFPFPVSTCPQRPQGPQVPQYPLSAPHCPVPTSPPFAHVRMRRQERERERERETVREDALSLPVQRNYPEIQCANSIIRLLSAPPRPSRPPASSRPLSAEGLERLEGTGQRSLNLVKLLPHAGSG